MLLVFEGCCGVAAALLALEDCCKIWGVVSIYLRISLPTASDSVDKKSYLISNRIHHTPLGPGTNGWEFLVTGSQRCGGELLPKVSQSRRLSVESEFVDA